MRVLPHALVLAWLLGSSLSAALDPGSILSPRSSGWVVDQAGVLSAEQRAELTALGDAVRRRDGAELAVVVLKTSGSGDHRTFATSLFNHWALGDRVRNNGLLVYVAIEDRAAEIVLGDGIDSDADVARSDRIMEQEMVRRFRGGDPAGAIMAGARACAREFFAVTQDPGLVPSAAETDVEAPGQVARPSKETTRSKAQTHRAAGIPVPAIIGVVGVVGVAGWLGGRVWWRRRPRRCGRCSMTMVRLDEQADDSHLSAGEQLEEKLGSVDYDIWLCPGCGAIEKLRFGRWFTQFSRCPQCGAVTTSKSQRTLRAATRSMGGLVEIHESCRHCQHARTYTRTTPRITSSSGSRSSSSRSGGGRSSGRGSSGRW